MADTIVYIDGFNVYYGMFMNSPLRKFRWTNLSDYCRRWLKDDNVVKIYYFTSIVKGEAGARQQKYLNALRTCPNVEVVLGKFQYMPISVKLSLYKTEPRFEFKRPQEKATDVNIALQMFYDAISDNCEKMVLVSGDTDLAPACAWIKTIAPKRIHLCIPSFNRRKERLATGVWKKKIGSDRISIVDKIVWLPTDLVRHCQFPDVIEGPDGPIEKPPQW